MKSDRRPTRNTLTDQVVSMLISDIQDGTYAPGSRLPSETELVKALGVGKITVRNAVAELRERGMVYTEHGRGTFVTRSEVPPPVLERSGADPWLSLKPVGETHHERGYATIQIADLLKIPVKDFIFIAHRQAVCTITDQPVLTTRVIASTAIEDAAADINERADRADLIKAWTKQHGPLNTVMYVRSLLLPADKWHKLKVTEPTAATETIHVTETADHRPLMLEIELSAADARTAVRFPAAAGHAL